MERTCLVTGGSGGIGTATAQALADAETTVAVHYRSDEQGADTAATAAEAAGATAITLQADLTKGTSVTELRNAVQDRIGRVDVLVTAAGVATNAPFVRQSEHAFEDVLDANLRSTIATTRAFYGDLRDSACGRLVTLSSTASTHPRPGQTSYATAKAGIEGFTRAIATELARADTTANCVAPGPTTTDMLEELPAETREQLVNRYPRDRFAEPEEVAAVIAFLASEDAGFVSGETVHVTGGPIR